MASEDEVDTETLQAQIDLSMSFMHGLVSSWIKPGSKQPARSDRNSKLEDELRESMKRPPRLGVGATVPESTAASSREAARLKGQLIGKRKNRTEGDEDALTETSTRKKGRSSDDDEDEDESRATAIKRKIKSNPFTPQKAGGTSTSRNTMKSIVSNREIAVPIPLDTPAQKTLDQEGARKGTALSTAASRAPNSPSSPRPIALKESATPSTPAPQRASQRIESTAIPQMKSPTNNAESGTSQRSKNTSAKEAVDSQKHIDKKDHKGMAVASRSLDDD
ncbi:hypothetical protein VNI00_001230 [Paramarasmius palmivorus]|uniref:Uncharacterized protein n=1 Tax=Paramarasmius palmivorus TaxID=297713 RepID=A0AAW0EB17_9AGAR